MTQPAGQAKPKKTWTRRAEARPDEILEAALDAFIERGFDGARIEDIAASAGLSKGAVYLYFESKEALLRALIDRNVAPVIAEAIPYLRSDGDPVAAARIALTLLATRFKDPRIFAVPRLVMSVAGRFPEIARHYRQSVVARAKTALEGLIERAVSDGVLRSVDASAAARSLIGPILFEALWTHVLGGPSAFEEPERFVRAQLDLWLNGVAAEARP